MTTFMQKLIGTLLMLAAALVVLVASVPLVGAPEDPWLFAIVVAVDTMAFYVAAAVVIAVWCE